MKTVEITRHKQAATGAQPAGTWAVFADIYRREGIRGINKGVNAVAVRQCTNWGSRMGFARLAESGIRIFQGKGKDDKLGALEKIAASSVGGALATWNQPIEVVRVEVGLASPDSVGGLTQYLTDAIHGQGCCRIQSSGEADHREHALVHLQGEWDQGLVPRCHSTYWSRHLADRVHGFLCRLR
jgi:hypothetical protein